MEPLMMIKFDPKIKQNLFHDVLNNPSDQKTAQKKKPKALTVFKKEGGGPARYDHAHRFNGFFFFTPSLREPP